MFNANPAVLVVFWPNYSQSQRFTGYANNSAILAISDGVAEVNMELKRHVCGENGSHLVNAN